MLHDLPLLSLLIWLPIFGGLALLMIGNDKNTGLVRMLALVISLVAFAMTIDAYLAFDPTMSKFQLEENLLWIDAFGVYYHLGIDGISLPLILLTAFITPLVIISSWQVIQSKVTQYLAAFLIMQGLIIGVFASLDAILFYVFWEAVLIPMFIIIGIWGGPNRIYATIKFFLYTFFGSLFMLLAIIYLYTQSNSFFIPDYYALPLTLFEQSVLFFAFLIAFAVKVPMWPVHTWLPDAHVEAPTGGSVVLAAIMLKMGGYGFFRLSLPILPDASEYLAGFMIFLSLVAVVYIGFVAIVQKDMKKLIAYSSVAHMGFVTLGLFICYSIVRQTNNVSAAVMGMEGSMVQMISHGFISGAMFLCVGVLYDRMHSRKISDYGGVANTMPVFAAMMMVFALANSGLPGTSGFVGEFLVILSSFQASFWIAVLAATTLILAPAYTLWMYKRVIFGEVANEQVAQLGDLNAREVVVLTTLLALVLLFGIWPNPLLQIMTPSIENLVQLALASKI